LAKYIDSLPLEHRAMFWRQKPASMMVWAGLTSDGQRSPLIFIKEGVMINQHNYNEILESKVFPWVNSKYAGAPYTFQQDGVLAHMAKLVQDWCRENLSHCWIGRRYGLPQALTSTLCTLKCDPCLRLRLAMSATALSPSSKQNSRPCGPIFRPRTFVPTVPRLRCNFGP